MKINLTKPQYQVSTSDKRFRVLISGRRFGKTYLAITEMMKYAALPNQKIWYVAPTLKMAKDICWSNLKEILNKFNWIEDINETTLTIRIRKTNSTISLKGADNYDALRGTGLNFLILDEPTNHLDMASKEILKDALVGYSGTLLLVSHDREFLDGLTDRVYFIKDKTIKVYHEPVTQFIESYYGDLEVKKETKKVEVKKPNNKKVQNQQKSLERKITKLEEKQTSLEFELYETSDAEKLKEIQSELDHIKREIEKNFELLMSFGN